MTTLSLPGSFNVSALTLFLIVLFQVPAVAKSNNDVKVAYFRADVTPPLGSPLVVGRALSIQDSLSARGVVITSNRFLPIVLCAVDWVSIANESMDTFRSQLALSANTSVDRVSIHVVHQHDTPWCDFSTEKIMREYRLGGIRFDNPEILPLNWTATKICNLVVDYEERT